MVSHSKDCRDGCDEVEGACKPGGCDSCNTGIEPCKYCFEKEGVMASTRCGAIAV